MGAKTDRKMRRTFDVSPMPLVPSPDQIGCAGGLYSSARDMQKWMAWHLDRGRADDSWRTIDHAGWLWRDGPSTVSGIDDAGVADMHIHYSQLKDGKAEVQVKRLEST